MQKIVKEEKVARIKTEDTAELAVASSKEEFPNQNLSQGCHGLSQCSVEQSNDQPVESEQNSDSCSNRALAESDKELIIVSETHNQSRKHVLADKESPTRSRKTLRSERQYKPPEQTVAKNINFFKASIQRKAKFRAEEGALEWEPVKDSAGKELFLEVQRRGREHTNSLATVRTLYHDERRFQISINEATETIRRLLDKESIVQVRALLKGSRKSRCSVQWPEILHPPLCGNISDLMTCCRQFAQSNTAFDSFGENLTRSELHRRWTWKGLLKLDPVTSEEKHQRAIAIRDGGKLRILADAFGVGFLAFIPKHPHVP